MCRRPHPRLEFYERGAWNAMDEQYSLLLEQELASYELFGGQFAYFNAEAEYDYDMANMLRRRKHWDGTAQQWITVTVRSIRQAQILRAPACSRG